MPPSKPGATTTRYAAETPLDGTGLRMTKQRKVVYDVLLSKLDHPTATEVFLRAKERMNGISLATVYNCLETLADSGLVKQVNIDRAPSRYCPNLHEHAHFVCTGCNEVQDIDPRSPDASLGAWHLPAGSKVDHIEVAMKGLCAKCAASKAGATA